jgi:predicted acylesterase/phospholipase RssA/CRP-like cAMP-binding protein
MEDRLASFLQSTELFHSAGPAAVADLISDLHIIELADGQTLVAQGDHNPNLYLLKSGRLLVTAYNQRNEPRLMFAVSQGESANENSILSDDCASASIISSGESIVLALPRATFENFAAKYPTDALQVMQSLSERMQRYHLSIQLHRNTLFDNLGTDFLHDLEEELEILTLYGGEVLFRQGDPGDFLCLVVRGRVRVRVHESGGGDTTVTELGSGEIVGEMGVFTGESRTSTVEAVRDSQLAKLSRAGFERLVAKHPSAVMQAFSRKFAERLQDAAAGSKRSRSIVCVAVIPAHPGAPLPQFCADLRQVLEQFGSTVHLSSALVDRHLGRAGMAQTFERGGNNIRLVEWLSELEIASDYLLYEADPFLSPWAERCIRQADHVLVVGDAKADPMPGEIETELLGARHAHGSPTWLVLVHGQENPSGTKYWLDARTDSHILERHFHVRLGQSEGCERIVRFLTGRAIGLTLGGGFARSLAHVGVYRAFTDLGIPVDAIGGASMGALVGALLAMGWDSERIVREVSAGCANPYFGDLTFPFIAFKTGKMLSKLVRSLFGNIQIEDLWIPYFCISANLNQSELKIHDRGPLARAVLSTTRAPGLFPPVVYEGELHVDGGVINNVPVDIMKAFSNEGIIIGVDVSPPHELHPIHDYGDDVSGWQACWKRLSPFVKKSIYTPSILLVMIRTLEYTGVSYKGSRLKYADLYMYPEMLKFKRTDFHLASRILDAGYDCARNHLVEWLSQPSTASRRPDLVDLFHRYKGGAAETDDSLLADIG